MLLRLGEFFSSFTKVELEGQRFPRKLLLIPVGLGVAVALLNLQWMQIYQLINAPKADSLVYLTEAYRDYWMLRDEGIGKLLAKYVVAGGQQTSPLLWWGAMISFLFFGLAPVNAYLFIALAYLGWIAGVVYLAWQIRPDAKYAIGSGLLAALLPSAVSHGLRGFMLDFVAAVPFVWATAMLLKSDFLTRRREALLYGLLCGVTVLFRTTIAPYFLAHAVILVVLALMHKRRINLANMGVVVVMGVMATAWFLLPNLGRILGYYGYWAKVASAASGGFSFADNLAFYLGLLPFYHLTMPLFIFSVAWMGLSLAILLARNYRTATERNTPPLTIKGGILVLLILGITPMLVLSFYPSRAASVDFPYIAAFVLIPPLLWREVAPRGKIFWLPMGILLAAFCIQQFSYLVRSPSADSEFQDFREREAIALILDDAEKRGLTHLTLGNTAIYQHNSLSYQYWILANYFPRWRGKVKGVALGRTDSPEELAKMNMDADYVIVLEHYQADSHPNNRAAPAANKLLEERYGMRPLAASLALPGGVALKILARQVGVQIPSAASDGWHENHVPVAMLNPTRSHLALRLRGQLFDGNSNAGAALVSLYAKSDPAIRFSFSSASAQIDHTFLIPPDLFGHNGHAEFVLDSSWAGKPSAISLSQDTRELAFSSLSLTVSSAASGMKK